MSKCLTPKEAAIVEACYFQPRYGGEKSEKFWNEVRRATNDRTLYDFACALQDLESRVLAVVNEGVRKRARQTIISQRKRRHLQASEGEAKP